MKVPFNRPYLTGAELANIEAAQTNFTLAGDGYFTQCCQKWFEKTFQLTSVQLTHSCTAALEMSAILLNIKAGDEVILPSYTFVSTANAFVLRGASPVFVDIRADTLNLDEAQLESAITNKTRAIVPVHYAGVACEMDSMLLTASDAGIKVIEDAAQGVMSSYKGKSLGSLGDLGAYSFHETKNIISGEGGALLVNDERLVEQAEIIWEKGTDRSQFFRGQVDKYTWQSLGSSFLPGELIAAFLWAQLEEAESITSRRIQIWDRYHSLFEELEAEGLLRRPVVPEHCGHNAHMYYLLLPEGVCRDSVLASMKDDGVNAVFHYVPLHSSPAGQRYGRVSGSMKNTDKLSQQLIRLPLWIGISYDEQRIVFESVYRALKSQDLQKGLF